MCSIIGINGQNVNNRLFKMLNILKHRGPDATGIYSNGKLFFNEETDICQECVDLRISIEREVVRKFNEIKHLKVHRLFLH